MLLGAYSDVEAIQSVDAGFAIMRDASVDFGGTGPPGIDMMRQHAEQLESSVRQLQGNEAGFAVIKNHTVMICRLRRPVLLQ